MRTAIFQRNGTGWSTADGLLAFSGDAGRVYQRMLEEHPDIRVGFRSVDIGANALMAFGPVVWMRTAEEQHQ